MDSKPKKSNSKDIKLTVLPKKKSLYKTEFCRTAEEEGSCPYGEKCQFAHSREELRSLDRHPRYKTEMCKTYWEKGSCPYGKRCVFIHSQEPMDESMSLHQPRQRVLSQQVGSLQNDSKHKRIQSAMEEINHNAPSPNNNGSNLKHGINHTNGNGNGNGQSGNNRSATIPIPSPSRHFRSLSNNTTNTKKPSLSVATSFQLQKPSLDFSITAPAYGVNSIPSANNDVGILKSALPEGVGFSDGLGLSDMTDGKGMGFHLNYTSQTPSVNTASSGFNPLAPGFTPSSFSTPPGFNGSNSTPQSPFNSSAPKSPFPEFAAQTGFPSSAPQSPFAEYPSQAQFNNQAPGFNPTSPQSFTGQNYGFYTAPRKTKPLSIAIAPGSPLRGQSLSALPRENEKDEMWGPLSAFPGGSSAFSGSFTGASSFTGNGNGNGTIASSFTSGGSVGNGNAFPIGSLDKSFEKMSVGSISNGFSMPPGFKPQKHYFENQPSPLATTFEFGQETFEPPSSPVFRSLNRKRVNDVWQKQMFTPSTSPERSPVKEKGLEEFVESLISPPNSP